jgi:hypothetical protein
VNCTCGGEFGPAPALGYYVEFTGPTADVSVDVSGFYKLTANGPTVPSVGPLTASAVRLFVNPNPADLTKAQYIVNAGVNDGATVSPFSTVLSLPTGTPIEVGMEAFTSFTEYPGSMSASAYLDPYFSIDPSNPDASAYSILTSPGVGNAPGTGVLGTPEPSTWAMMLLGFAGLGWAGWRRRVVRTAGMPA